MAAIISGGAIDVVTRSLAELGWDAEWTCVKASDLGAPHQRLRWFCIAWPAGQPPFDLAPELTLPGVSGLDAMWLPTPAVNDMGAGKSVEEWDDWTARMREKHGNGNGHGKSLAIEAQRISLLPTPTAIYWARNNTSGRTDPDSDHHSGDTLSDIAHADRWGEYGPAILRWENLLGRPAPYPVDDQRRLDPPFPEWMMGWPEGHTDVPGLTRSHRLKAIGNGVVPKQAAHAYRHLLNRLWEDPAFLDLEDVPGIGPGTRALLEDDGILDVMALDATPDDELLAIKGVGPAALTKIRTWLEGMA